MLFTIFGKKSVCIKLRVRDKQLFEEPLYFCSPYTLIEDNSYCPEGFQIFLSYMVGRWRTGEGSTVLKLVQDEVLSPAIPSF